MEQLGVFKRAPLEPAAARKWISLLLSPVENGGLNSRVATRLLFVARDAAHLCLLRKAQPFI
jgi:hypothetical protein